MQWMRNLVIGTWGALAYKPAFQATTDGKSDRLPGSVAASWVPEAERRRLVAYTLLAAYDTNQAAALLGEAGDDRRKYGDTSLIVDQTLSHLLGETQQVVVDGAEDNEAAQERENWYGTGPTPSTCGCVCNSRSAMPCCSATPSTYSLGPAPRAVPS